MQLQQTYKEKIDNRKNRYLTFLICCVVLPQSNNSLEGPCMSQYVAKYKYLSLQPLYARQPEDMKESWKQTIILQVVYFRQQQPKPLIYSHC